MHPDRREPRSTPERHLQAVDSRIVTPEQLRKERNVSVMKVIDSMRPLTDGEWYSPSHLYAREEWNIIAQTRGINPYALPQGQADAPVTITPADLNNATAVVLEHDALSPQERFAVGLPLGPEGIPMVADVQVCLAYLDELDPTLPDYTLDQYAGHGCTYSCSCEVINPEHRRENLYTSKINGGGVDIWDPEGLAEGGRVVRLREQWRRELAVRNAHTRQELAITMQYNATRRDNYDKATGLGISAAARKGSPEIGVDPRFIQAKRDEKRATQGRHEVVPEGERPELARQYVGDMQRMYKKHGITPPSAARILGPGVDRYADTDPRELRGGLLERAAAWVKGLDPGRLKNGQGKNARPVGGLSDEERLAIEGPIEYRHGQPYRPTELQQGQPAELPQGQRPELTTGTAPDTAQTQQTDITEAYESGTGFPKLLQPHELPEGYVLNRFGLPVEKGSEDEHLPPLPIEAPRPTQRPEPQPTAQPRTQEDILAYYFGGAMSDSPRQPEVSPLEIEE